MSRSDGADDADRRAAAPSRWADVGPSHEAGGGFVPRASAPLRVEGGIRAQSPPQRPGREWWSRRWFAAVDASVRADRVQRGREYAVRGQVREFEVARGVVRALVQGSRREPYDVELRLPEIDQLSWLGAARELAQRASTVARLTAGEMPDDVEAQFARLGLTLFPTLEEDLELRCGCDDWAVPCRHAMATCFLLGEVLDRDPLVAMRLRGIEPDVLRALIHAGPASDGTNGPDGALRAGAPPTATVDAGEDAAAAEGRSAGVPLSADDVDAFWRGSGDRLPEIDPSPPPVTAPLVRVLGPVPLWRGRDPFEQVVRRMYERAAASARVVDIAYGAAAAVEPGSEARTDGAPD